MVVTVTLNPALDYVAKVDDIALGKVNRTIEETVYPGGKGINVSLMLSQLGVPNRALGFAAGFTGKELRCCLDRAGCIADLIEVSDGMTRINVKIRSVQETELNGIGPVITKDALQRLFWQIGCLSKGDIVVLAGSIPGGLPNDLYEQILQKLPSGVTAVVDASGPLLRKVLPYYPFLIKPNHHELGELFGAEITMREEALFYAKQLQKLGARNIVVSMAQMGAVMICESGDTFAMDPPKGKLVNSVGAGDSLVAGFLAGFLKTGSLQRAFELGVAAGSASAYSEWLASRETVLSFLNRPEEYGL